HMPPPAAAAAINAIRATISIDRLGCGVVLSFSLGVSVLRFLSAAAATVCSLKCFPKGCNTRAGGASVQLCREFDGSGEATVPVRPCRCGAGPAWWLYRGCSAWGKSHAYGACLGHRCAQA